ncbi:hypothetical protein EG68_00815 [Paragonimus skrjabini miyazakii]|uniref:Uncharacterized protein n=1 Tax=Paragonimus skrjabini miyazakii TaxID=59628 RepID=A0A8S9Z936_9TREM|nr:hypothetical protein EG68_00815 [Paragonimus skrjabini miyazakii]
MTAKAKYTGIKYYTKFSIQQIQSVASFLINLGGQQLSRLIPLTCNSPKFRAPATRTQRERKAREPRSE